MENQNNKLEILRAATKPFNEWAAQYAKPEPASDVLVQGDFRPEVWLPGPDRLISDVAKELGAVCGKSGFYQRAGLVWYYDIVVRKLRLLDARGFLSRVQRFARLMDFTGRGEHRRGAEVTMTLDCSANVLACAEFYGALPEIKRVLQVPVPVWRDGGKRIELLARGFDNEYGVLVTDGPDMVDMTFEEAVDFLDSVLVDFAFEESQKLQMLSNQLGSMLAPYVDMLVRRRAPRPVFVWTGNTEGSGKTTAGQLSLIPVHGALQVSPPPDAGNGEELRKLLFSAVLAAEPYIFFDNWKGKIGGASLEAFVTSNVWSDRVLGRSEKVAVDKDTLIFITANDAKLSPDMRRRSVYVEMFIKEARSENRPISRVLDEETMLGLRPQLLGALWAFVKHWQEKGCPAGTVANTSWADWAAKVGGICEACGLMSPAAAIDVTRGGDTDLVDFEYMLEHLMKDVPTMEGIEFIERDLCHIRPAAVLEYARHLGLFASVVADEEPTNDRDKRKERAIFAKICGRFAGRTMTNGWQFLLSDHASRNNRHFIVCK